MGSFWGLSVQLVTFREHGILRRFRLAPSAPDRMLASSILSNYFLVCPSVALKFSSAAWSPHAILGKSVGDFPAGHVWLRHFFRFGLIVASVTNTMQETQMINRSIWMAFLFLSGATVPLAVFPPWIQRASLFMPATYLATGLEAASPRISHLPAK